MPKKRASQQIHTQTSIEETRIAGDEKASFLASTGLFQHLQADEIQALARIATLQHCHMGRILYHPGEAGGAFFILKVGSIQMYHLSSDGRKLITQTVTAGDCFGAFPTSTSTSYTTFAEATSNSQLYVITREDMETILRNKPAVAYAFLKMMGQRLLELEERLTSTTFQSVTARLATLLLQLAQSQQNPRESQAVHGYSHEDLADRLGVYRETVSAALRELKDSGAIEIGRKHITISHPEQLETVAETGGKTRNEYAKNGYARNV